MRKLKPKDVDDLKKQLGGDVVIRESNVDLAGGTETRIADARVPSLDSLRANSESGSARSSTLESDTATGTVGKKKRASSARTSNPGKSDYSVRFSSKNADRGSKVAIVSSKYKKVVYEQG